LSRIRIAGHGIAAESDEQTGQSTGA